MTFLDVSRIIVIAALGGFFLPVAVHADPLQWPLYDADQGYLRVDQGMDRGDGFTNSVPDIVGPLDGSAKLTIFTEGNHYPVLLPLALEAFPRHCANTRRCDIEQDEIMVVTLPQVMIVGGLEAGGFRFGNAQLPVDPDGQVFPDVVMLGERAMGRLHKMDLLGNTPRVFARHRGMGLLVDRQRTDMVAGFDAFAASGLNFVMATPREAGARDQYVTTLNALFGKEATEHILEREVTDFPGRLAIQHRDIPYAVMNDVAPVGLVFGHLARFYADHWPNKLAFVEIPEAVPFGQEIVVARTDREGGDAALAETFIEFLMDAAPAAYEAGGFTPVGAFGFGREVSF
ncbi:MAG: substrate-binding domain-containing protein [Methyloceanibacter sp.]|nr:substrate-binding domain-containing protein [Methyloceanibacter sp.]